jgi:hypothetical protein
VYTLTTDIRLLQKLPSKHKAREGNLVSTLEGKRKVTHAQLQPVQNQLAFHSHILRILDRQLLQDTQRQRAADVVSVVESGDVDSMLRDFDKMTDINDLQMEVQDAWGAQVENLTSGLSTDEPEEVDWNRQQQEYESQNAGTIPYQPEIIDESSSAALELDDDTDAETDAALVSIRRRHMGLSVDKPKSSRGADTNLQIDNVHDVTPTTSWWMPNKNMFSSNKNKYHSVSNANVSETAAGDHAEHIGRSGNGGYSKPRRDKVQLFF